MATETTERGSVEEKVRILFPYLITLKTSLLVVVALSTKFQKEVCLNSLKTETNITCLQLRWAFRMYDRDGSGW